MDHHILTVLDHMSRIIFRHFKLFYQCLDQLDRHIFQLFVYFVHVLVVFFSFKFLTYLLSLDFEVIDVLLMVMQY